LEPSSDELLEIAIIDDIGAVVLDTLIKPVRHTSWPEAESIHGITPEMVANAPVLTEVAHKIEEAVTGKDVIIYNANFDAGFLGSLLSSANSVQCCMEAWAEHVGEWSEYHGNYRYQTLDNAAHSVHFEWPGESHRAMPDAFACRAVWQYLVDPTERERVDAIIQEKTNARIAEMALRELCRKEKAKADTQSRWMGRFIECWWLGQYGLNSHWTHNRYRFEMEEELALIFFGRSLHSLKLEDKFEITYKNKKAIPSNLKPASHFPTFTWYQVELKPCAAYIGKKRAWPLYDTSEDKRIRDLYPLRFSNPTVDDNNVLLTRTKLKKAGLSDKKIATLEPVAELQNPHNYEWYYLYKVEIMMLPDPDSIGKN